LCNQASFTNKTDTATLISHNMYVFSINKTLAWPHHFTKEGIFGPWSFLKVIPETCRAIKIDIYNFIPFFFSVDCEFCFDVVCLKYNCNFFHLGTHLNAAVMSMLKTKGSKTSASEEIQERYSEETQGNCLCNLYIVIVHLRSKRIVWWFKFENNVFALIQK
jgi:hypothetical protein